MRRLFICTLGFEEKFIVRSIMRHGLGEGDKVLLLTARPINERVERAYAIIRDFIAVHYKANAELCPIALDSFAKGVGEVRRKLHEELRNGNYEKIVINLTGGLRALVLAVYTAYLLLPNDVLSGKDVVVEVEFEDSSRLVNIPRNVGLVVRNFDRLRDRHREILVFLAEKGDNSIISLSNALNLDVSTVRRYVYELADLGLIHEQSNVKPHRVSIDESAYMVI